MSDVNRYTIGADSFGKIYRAASSVGEYVLSSDYDAMASELATWKQMHAEQLNGYNSAMIVIGKELGVDISDEPRCKHVVTAAAAMKAELAALKGEQVPVDPIAMLDLRVAAKNASPWSDTASTGAFVSGAVWHAQKSAPALASAWVPVELLERTLTALDECAHLNIHYEAAAELRTILEVNP